MADNTAALTVMLNEARTAYHQLMLGQGIVSIRDSNGEQIQYNITSATRLAAYISSLEMQLGLSRASGPMTTWMGQ